MAPIRCLLNGSKIKYRPYHTNSPPPFYKILAYRVGGGNNCARGKSKTIPNHRKMISSDFELRNCGEKVELV